MIPYQMIPYLMSPYLMSPYQMIPYLMSPYEMLYYLSSSVRNIQMELNQRCAVLFVFMRMFLCQPLCVCVFLSIYTTVYSGSL
jgi:hypothetical protein